MRRTRALRPHRHAAQPARAPLVRRRPDAVGPGLVCGALGGLLLAIISSAGILAERVERGDARVVALATAAAAATGVLLLATTFRRSLAPLHGAEEAPAASPATPSRVIGAQALGAILGVVAVHLLLCGSPLRSCGWLCEGPRQLVNDFAAVFGALGLVWGCVRQPVGPFASLAAIALAALYALTSPRWHVDAWTVEGSLRSISVQIAVMSQIACTAVGVAVFHRLRGSDPPVGAA